jgi:hypothetical protein
MKDRWLGIAFDGRIMEEARNRRDLLVMSGSAGLLSALGMSSSSLAAGSTKPFFEVRGAVLRPDDLTTVDWVSRAKAAHLTALATHDRRRRRGQGPFCRNGPGSASQKRFVPPFS